MWGSGSIHPDLRPPNTNDVPPESPPGGTSVSPLPENSESPPKEAPEKRKVMICASVVYDVMVVIVCNGGGGGGDGGILHVGEVANGN